VKVTLPVLTSSWVKVPLSATAVPLSFKVPCVGRVVTV